ncbi:MAG: Bifunctional protein GlmU [Planctomycetota bacterium]|jgi:bifunctional UDP-N-acetylglucosamine pyrophosphorylase/glucosamine-1-phosphate N-acetyltransferase
MSATVAVVLAAGRSTRMKSEVPKVLHPVCGRPMIEYVLDAARAAGAQKLIVVVGHRADLVREALRGHADVVFAEQTEQKGTGHAVMMCEPVLSGSSGSVLILAGDTPLLRGTSLQSLLDRRDALQAACVIGTARTENNEGLGRIVRDAAGHFVRIVEQKDASPEERLITEINTGCYAFSTPRLLESLQKIRPNNKQGEYYLTDCPRVLMDDGHTVEAACSLTLEEALGVNTRVQLADARSSIQKSILEQLMLDGVTIEDPGQTSIEYGVSIGSDTVIRPFTVIERGAVIGPKEVIGPFAHIRCPK